MSGWVYMMETILPTLQGNRNCLIRQKDGITERWTSQTKRWKKDNDVIGAFIGFEDHYGYISEDEANKIISQYK